MMFMIGQGERVVPVGSLEQRFCPGCKETADFQTQLRYKFGEFDLLFGFVYAKRYQLACTRCNHGWILDTKTVEKTHGKAPIPLRLRFGFVVLLAAIAVLGAAAHAITN
jgi:hypothetical protein